MFVPKMNSSFLETDHGVFFLLFLLLSHLLCPPVLCVLLCVVPVFLLSRTVRGFTSPDRRLGTACLLYQTGKTLTSATYHFLLLCHVENSVQSVISTHRRFFNRRSLPNTDHVTRTITCLLQQTNRPPSFPQ